LKKQKNGNDTCERPIEVAEGVFWVGFHDPQAGLHCNPYVIIDGEEAVVIDGGSRPDFATVMLKILQTGILPQQIKALIYQHYDPDLCGSIPNFEDTIQREDLKILSASENLMFIRHYSVSSRLVPLSKLDFQFEFASGRRLEFIKTPYAHAAGSFTTFDPHTRVLFTSDLFGSYGRDWQLYLQLLPECRQCQSDSECIRNLPNCPVNSVVHFHQKIMPSTMALRYALKRIAAVPFEILAPQHGSIIKDKQTIAHLFERLASLQGVGIDGICGAEAVGCWKKLNEDA
jgi:flavorubredoxin